MLAFMTISLFLCFARISAEYQLSICALFQDEAPYLKEWIDFHIKVGVEHFWLYNNLSKDNFREIIAPYIEKGIVELIEWRKPCTNSRSDCPLMQYGAYNDAIQRSLYKTRWLAVIDSDEYLFPVEKNSLIDFLEDYEDYSAIGVNWIMFGTSHVPYLAPHEKMLEKLVWRARLDHPLHKTVKCIVKPKHVSLYANPHFPVLKPGFIQVNPDKIPFDGPRTDYCSFNKIRLNHYWTRDEAFLSKVKIPRYLRLSGNDLQSLLGIAAELNEVYDTDISKFYE
jgi:Glycosyltransferase family 92